jgi:glycosyltransferase involved in cell wall biosynthesis
MIDATIAIITYKRPVWLLRLLKSLAGQEFGDNLKIEFLVVDNACEKETEKIVNKVGDSFGRVIHYIAERKKGIVAARNTAVAFFLKSSSKNLLFIDDDEWPQRNDWAQTEVAPII